ncbi:MAG TPA: hypothetical protein VF596_13540 [Pyrinomonadaceae bacterium]|jgi:hypothetical protein
MRYKKILAQSHSSSRHSLFQELPFAAVSFYNADYGKVLEIMLKVIRGSTI